jgi:hypothetical protein
MSDMQQIANSTAERPIGCQRRARVVRLAEVEPIEGLYDIRSKSKLMPFVGDDGPASRCA